MKNYKNTLKKNEAVYRSSNGVLAIMWQDNKDDYVIYMSYWLIIWRYKVSKRQRGIEDEEIKPRIFTDYNNGMFGVDQIEQSLSSYPIMQHTVKAYMKMFFNLLDMVTYNSFVIYNKVKSPQQTEKRHYTDFRINLTEHVLSST